jgi:hypothetical protein
MLARLPFPAATIRAAMLNLSQAPEALLEAQIYEAAMRLPND